MIAYLSIFICFLIGIFVSIKFFGNLLDFVVERTSGRGVQNGAWKTHLGVGRKNTARIEKAAIARIGLGANDSDETIYWNAFLDNNGNELHSKNEYSLLFKSKPAVRYDDKGFWSITVYGNDKFLVTNSDYKYVMRSDFNYDLNEDSSFSIFLARKKPQKHSNWLPLPENDENFSIAFRCYIPTDELKNNTQNNEMPLIIKNEN